MRKSLVLMTLVGSFLLSSCSFFSTVQSYEETVHLYDLDKIAKNPEDNDINKAEVTTVDALFIKGEKYIPYLVAF